MSDVGWLALRVEVALEAADAVANFLMEEGAPGVITAAGDELPPAPGHARLEAHVPAPEYSRVAAALARYLRSLESLLPGLAPARVESSPVAPVDWEAEFRRHHHPRAIGRRLLVAPPWDVPAAADRVVLVVEPGMAFGTGQHETTRTCLEEVEDAVGGGTIASALDVGTGSGILAAGMARLGVPRVVALDTDAAVLPLARAMLVRNGAAAVHLLAGGAAAVRERFHLVVANLLGETLVAESATLAARVAPGGRLVLSGILDVQTEPVLAAYPEWRLAAERRAGPWRTVRLVRAADGTAARATA